MFAKIRSGLSSFKLSLDYSVIRIPKAPCFNMTNDLGQLSNSSDRRNHICHERAVTSHQNYGERTSPRSAKAGVDLTTLLTFITHRAREASMPSCHEICARYCTRHWLQRWKDTGTSLNSVGEKACKQAVITKGMMALLEGCTKEGLEKEHLEKHQQKVALWWSLAGDKLGENVPGWGRYDGSTTWPRMIRNGWNVVKCVLDLFLGGKKREVHRLCMLSIFFPLWI